MSCSYERWKFHLDLMNQWTDRWEALRGKPNFTRMAAKARVLIECHRAQAALEESRGCSNHGG